MNKKYMTSVLSLFLIFIYIAIIMYIFFGVVHVNTLVNFQSAIIFELIGFFILTYLVFSNILSKTIKIGFFVPLVIVTIVYTIILDIVNIVLVVTMPHVFFLLINLVLLFIYCLVSIPMYIMGRK